MSTSRGSASLLTKTIASLMNRFVQCPTTSSLPQCVERVTICWRTTANSPINLGITDEYIDEINASIRRMEKAMEDERQANELVEATKRKLEAAADEYVRVLNEADQRDHLSSRSKKNGH